MCLICGAAGDTHQLATLIPYIMVSLPVLYAGAKARRLKRSHKQDPVAGGDAQNSPDRPGPR